MTPKEKALQLINIFKNSLDIIVPNDSIKQNVLKCVYEIIFELSDLPKIPYNERRLDYWKEVKEEVEKL